MASTAFTLGAVSVVTAAADGNRPNVIVFFSDQQRWDTVGCYGQKLPLTPNLDRMAAEGVRFEYAFTCQPVCGPARAVLQTGKYATEIGCFRNGIPLPASEKTIAQWFSEAGYEVGYIGKWHLASTRAPKPVPPDGAAATKTSGWPPTCWSSRRTATTATCSTARVGSAISRRADTAWTPRPTGCWSTCGPAPARSRSSCSSRTSSRIIRTTTTTLRDPRAARRSSATTTCPGDLVGTEGDWRENYPDYLGCIHSLDQNLGRVREELEKLGLAENTLLIYTSDHGCHFRTRNSEYKRSCHDGCTRIPLVACGPGFRGGKVVEDLVSLIDVPPTMLAAGGIPTPTSMQGRPLQQLVDGTAKDWPEEVFIQISESQVGRAIRTKRWKYSVRAPGRQGNRDSGSDEYVEDFLYDLEKDPHERSNLVADPALAPVLRNWRKDSNTTWPGRASRCRASSQRVSDATLMVLFLHGYGSQLAGHMFCAGKGR